MPPRASAFSLRYAFDELNRLRVTPSGGIGDRLRPTRILEGRVTTDRRNRLVYRVDSRASLDGLPLRRRFNLDGTWGLTRDHRLKLTLHETAQSRRQTLYLAGRLEQATARALVVSLRRHTLDGRRTVQRITLRGRWQADARNRLTFLVDKAEGSADRLTLQFGWQVGPRHALMYRFKERVLARGRRTTHTLRFSGTWKIARANRLVYRLDVSGQSTFDFRASLNTPSLTARQGTVVYQIGIGVSRGRMLRRRVVLFGTWKLHRDLSLSFEVPYAGGRRTALRASGTVALDSRSTVTVALRDARGKPLGLSVTLHRRWVNNVGLFLKLATAGRRTEALAGVQIQF